MIEDDNTKDLSDRELLILLHRAASELNSRVERLEAKAYDTQPLPANFAARFTALEERVGAIEGELHEIKHSLLEFKVETRKNFKSLREDHLRERQLRAELEDRIELLESRLS